jgi:hypothetical protein
LFVDEITDAPSIASLGIIAGAVGKTNRTRSVTQEREGEAKFLGKSGVFFYRVKTDTEYLNVA